MEQNRLKELILSMRKSKHNMFKKVADFALAVEDKGVIDMDTHELSNLVKDTLTKRRAKTFYADVLSGVIGEHELSKTKDIFMALYFNFDTNETSPRTWSFGDAVVYTKSEAFPYVIMMSPSLAQKMTHIDSNIPDEILDNIKEMIMPSVTNFVGPSGDMTVEELVEEMGVDESYARDLVENGMHQITPYYLAPDALSGTAQLLGSDYVYITITYDGVDYKYDSDGKITITKSSNTTPVAKEAPTFRSISNQSGNYSVSTYTLGDPMIAPEDVGNDNGLIDPYMILLTDEEAQKFNVSCETNIPDSDAEELEEALKLFNIPSGSGLSQFKGNCTKGFNVFYLSMLSQDAAEYQSEIPDAYIKVTITYDGVDYVYLS